MGNENWVLLIEDDPEVAGVIGQILRRMGVQPVLAMTFESGLSCWNERHGDFAFAIVDYNLGDRSGGELAAQFLKERPAMPILLMTGFSLSALDLSEAIRRQVRFLEKPFTVHALRAAVADWLNR